MSYKAIPSVVSSPSSTFKGGIKSLNFSTKIKRKNQERVSVIYTELAIKPKFHRTAGANQARCKRRSLQAGR